MEIQLFLTQIKTMKGLISGLLFLSLSFPLTADDLQFGSGFWPLLSDTAATDEGRITRLIRDAYATVGLKVTRIEMPWARILSDVANSVPGVDGGYPFGKTKEREALFLFSDAVGAATRYIWYAGAKTFRWETVDDLRGLRIGVVRGAIFGPVHEQLRTKMAEDPGFATVEEVGNELSNFQKLAAGRVDIVFCEEHQAEVAMAQLPAADRSRIKAASKPIMDKALLFVLFSKNTRGEQLRDALNRGLKNLAFKLD